MPHFKRTQNMSKFACFCSGIFSHARKELLSLGHLDELIYFICMVCILNFNCANPPCLLIKYEGNRQVQSTELTTYLQTFQFKIAIEKLFQAEPRVLPIDYI